jgi:type IV pilus assembly protein PilA
MHNKNNGFSLIELLVVVGIVLIIAAIGIPSLLRAGTSANEVAAVAALRELNTACTSYAPIWGIGFPAALANLGPADVETSTAADLIDGVLASGSKSGYTFTYTAGPVDSFGVINSYVITANPIAVDKTGTRYFFTDKSGVIRQNVGGPADVTGMPVS